MPRWFKTRESWVGCGVKQLDGIKGQPVKTMTVFKQNEQLSTKENDKKNADERNSSFEMKRDS